MSSSRINLGKASQEMYQGVAQLDNLVTEQLAQAGIKEGFAHLLRLRASQLNQCAYCVRLHGKDAEDSGESRDRINVLPAWRETGYFTVKERAALALIEAVTLISVGQVPDAVYDEAANVLSQAEVAAIEWLGVVINAWNRIAISSRYAVKP